MSIKIFSSSIGKKITMAFTGILMCLFLVGHLLGNFLLFVGKEAFNEYANILNSTDLVYIAEFGLVVILVLHVVTAIMLSLENEAANNGKYAVKRSGGRRSWASSHMLHSGMVTLIFIIFHIYSFKFGNWDNAKDSLQTLYDLVVVSFQDPFYSGFYVICMIMIGFHLNHAIKSSCTTLGITNSQRIKVIEKISTAFSLIITLGFISIPAYFYLSNLYFHA